MKLLISALTKYLAGLFLVGLILFLPAGTLNYPGGWLFCGLLFIPMLILGIVIGLFVPANPFGIAFLRPVFKILLIPVTCGIGYELIKLCGKHDNRFTRIIAAPGLWAQRITTKEPDDSMMEVAIEAIKAVIPDDGSDIVNKCGC